MKKPPTASRLPAVAPDIEIAFTWTPMQRRLIEGALILMAIIAGLLYVLPMESSAGLTGFPMDDSWLHVSIARNLREFGSWSLFRDEMITAGSTSPLLVLAIALPALVVGHEVLVSMGIGILAFAFTLPLVFRVGCIVFRREQWLALAAAITTLLVPKLQSAAVSGMGTTLFMMLAVLAMLLYMQGRRFWFLLVAALSVWARPDGLVLLAAGAITWLVDARIARPTAPPGHPAVGGVARHLPWIAALVLLAGYAAFNLGLGGGILPNAVAAKHAYYAKLQLPGFPGQVFVFLAGPVLAVLLVFGLVQLLRIIIDLVRRRGTSLLLPALFFLGLAAAYWIVLPFLLDGGRHLQPALPGLILVSLAGVRSVFRALVHAIPVTGMRAFGNVATAAVLAGVLISGVARWDAMRIEHDNGVRYLRDRSIAAAGWVATNTPADAVIATHLPGVFSWFGDRRFLDFSGIASPEVIPSIGDLSALGSLLSMSRASYIATLRERFEVVNVNPVFMSDQNIPEVMEVSPITGKAVHIMPQEASGLNYQASLWLQQRKPDQAMQYLSRSYRLDPVSSRTLTLTGLAVLLQKDTAQALQLFDEAMRIQPDYAPAMVPIADIFIEKGNLQGAIEMLNNAIRINPRSQTARASLKRAQSMLSHASRPPVSAR